MGEGGQWLSRLGSAVGTVLAGVAQTVPLPRGARRADGVRMPGVRAVRGVRGSGEWRCVQRRGAAR